MEEKRVHPELAAAFEAARAEREAAGIPIQAGDPLTDGDPRQIPVGEDTGPNPALLEALQAAKETIALLKQKLDEIMAEPKVFGRVIDHHNVVNPTAFAKGDAVWVCDKDSPFYMRVGQIVEDLNEAEGTIICRFPDGPNPDDTVLDCLAVGLEEKDAAQVKLLGKPDGTYATILVGDTSYEVAGIPGWEFNSGEQVKVDMKTKQIIDKSDTAEAGVVAFISDNTQGSPFIEVEIDGEKKTVHRGVNPPEGETLDEGDKVVLDTHKQIVIRHILREGQKQFAINQECNITWGEVGGLDDCKSAIREAIELPFTHKEIFAHYNKKPPKGLLLYGPPGCGKTLVGKATTNSLANIFGRKAITSGFIYVKGPEILNMYVGESERRIREIFQRGRKHYEKYGFPAVLFIDEAEAVLSERGTSRSSDVDKTIVPMFLSEMDGLDENHAIVMLATNRPKMLDPAVVREGRVDRHIKVSRPTLETAPAIFAIHLRGVPVLGMDIADVAKRASADIFNARRKIYQITNGEFKGFFTFGDCITGSMIAGIAEMASSLALKRDIENKAMTGVTPDDVKAAVETIYQSHLTLNHKFDLEDYCERNGIQEENSQVARVKVKAA